jgi:hypothetical protein
MSGGDDHGCSEGSRLIEQALALYRNPEYAAGIKPASELPQGMEFLLRVANGDEAPLALAMRKTGAPEQELKQAAIRFIEQISFGPDDDPYRVLGLNPWALPEEAKEHYRLLIRLFHPDRGIPGHAASGEYAARINRSFSAIKNQSRVPAAAHKVGSGVSSHAGAQNARRPTVSPAPLHFDPSPRVLPGLDALPVRLTPQRVWGAIAVAAVLFVCAVYLANRGTVLGTREDRIAFSDITAVNAPASETAAAVGSRLDRLLESVAPPLAVQLPPAPMAEIENRAALSEISVGQRGIGQQASGPGQTASAVQPVRNASKSPQGLNTASHGVPSGSSAAPAINPADVTSHPDPMKNESTSLPMADGRGDDTARWEVRDTPAPEKAKVTGSLMPATVSMAHTEPTDDELHRVVGQFIGSYNRGDLEGFMALIDENIRTDEPGGKEGLREAYRRLFGNSVSREMLLKNLHWQRNGAQAVGLSDYRVFVSRPGDEAPRVYTGSIRLEVEKLEGRSLICGFYNRADRK